MQIPSKRQKLTDVSDSPLSQQSMHDRTNTGAPTALAHNVAQRPAKEPLRDSKNTKAPPTSLPPSVPKENQVASPGPPCCMLTLSTAAITVCRVQST